MRKPQGLCNTKTEYEGLQRKERGVTHNQEKKVKIIKCLDVRISSQGLFILNAKGG